MNEEKWSECIKVSVKRNILKVLCKVVNPKAVFKTINWRLHLVGVDGDTEEAGVGVDQLGLVTDHRVPENAGIAKESKVGHVFRHVKLGRKRSQQMSGINQANLPLEG